MLYALRNLYLCVHFLVVCVFALFYSLLRPRHINNTTFLASLMSWSLPVLGIRLERRNQSPIPPEGQAIYVINHQDTLDVFTCTGMLPDKIAILGKSSLRYVPIFGLSFWLAGNIYIDRTNKAKAWDTMATVADIVKKRGCSLYIFPEGTRSRGKGLQSFKSGAFVLAVRSGLPIVPIVFSSTHKHIDLSRLKAGVVAGEYLEPILTEGMAEDDVKPLMELTHARMKAALERLDAELEARSN